MPRDRRQPVVLDTPMSYAPWQPVAAEDVELSNPAPRAVERNTYAAEHAAVQRLLRKADATRAEFAAARRTATPTRKDSRMWSTTHQNDRQAAADTVPPPSADQLAWSRQLREGNRGGYEPAPFVPDMDDDYHHRFPYGPGFDRRGQQLPSNADVDHSRADMRRYNAARRSGFTNDDALDAREFVELMFDRDGNVQPGAPIYIGNQEHDIG